jgi:hypothetical protein
MDSVSDVGAKSGFVGLAAAEEVVAVGVKGGVAAGTGKVGKFRR